MKYKDSEFPMFIDNVASGFNPYDKDEITWWSFFKKCFSKAYINTRDLRVALLGYIVGVAITVVIFAYALRDTI